MTSYLVPAGFGQAEFNEKHSRFIGRVWPVSSEEEAVSRIRETREKHWDATHNVYAYLLREGNITRFSDDGEPGGTSGMPTLNVFRAAGIENVCCVVTRYFGGVLLGSGGLVRAYSATARLALEAAGVSRMARWQSFTVDCAYGQYEKLRRALEEAGAVVENADFAARVVIAALAEEAAAPPLLERLRDLSAGTAVITAGESRFRAVPLENA